MNMDQNIENSPGQKMQGFIKIWAVDPKTGERWLLRDQPNMILYAGADLMAQVLAGVAHTNISNIYVGYQNVASPSNVNPPTIDKAYSVPFANYGSGAYSNYGYLRLPLAYSPSFSSEPNYTSNIVLFTTIITTTNNATPTNSFKDSTQSPPSQIFEVALVSALNPSNNSLDKVFSRANFSPLTYDSNFNLTITWGVRFLA